MKPTWTGPNVSGLRAPAAWRDYVSLTKPRVISLLLLTTLAALIIAGDGSPSPWTIAATLLGGALAAGGAGALNCYFDADIDALMARTRQRPIPARRLAPAKALGFGLLLGLASFWILALGANLLAACLALAGLLFYVFVYTLWLKRRSTQNIVIGGAAGAIPPLVGWAAASGSLSLEAWLLFVIIFLWTPPHFWALALVRRDEYSRARVPMLPVVYGDRTARVHIVSYVLLLTGVTLLPYLLGFRHWIYALSALSLATWFVYFAVQLWQQPGSRTAWRLYKFSLLYLALLFAAMAADRMILG